MAIGLVGSKLLLKRFLSLFRFVLERLERRPDAGRRWEVLFFVVVIATHLLAASVRCFVPRWIFFPLLGPSFQSTILRNLHNIISFFSPLHPYPVLLAVLRRFCLLSIESDRPALPAFGPADH